MTRKYVVFEGIDCSGKSTLARMLVKALTNRNEPVRALAFPSYASAIGGLIRKTFEGHATVHPHAMLWLFVAEGKDMEPQIVESLTVGDWVICDRHTMISGLVYQGEVHGEDHVEAVTRPAGFTVPDRIYLVDVPAAVALERRRARNEARNKLYEPEEVTRLEWLCTAYQNLPPRFETSQVLDGTKPLEENLRWIWQDLGLSGDPL